MSGFTQFELGDNPRQEKLYIELVPRTAWGVNLRYKLSTADWDRLRKRQPQIAEYKCEICGESGRDQGWNWPVECHEVWSYNDVNQVQKLERLISLCPLCHKTKHMGRTLNVDGGNAADVLIQRMAKLNGWTVEQAQQHVDDAFEQWEKRSHVAWTLDLSYLDDSGVEILSA